VVTETLLAVDVGGTKCELAIFPLGVSDYAPIVRNRYACGDYGRLEDIIATFLEETGSTPTFASIGVAGVVSSGVGTVTNLPWIISEEGLTREFHLKAVHLINDMTAVCASLGLLEGDDLMELQEGESQPGQLIGVVAPGTGLGEGVLIQREGIFFPRGSEGGHTDFGPVGEEQAELLRWMLTRKSRVSYESLIAGPGIPNLYDFYHLHMGMSERPEVEAQMAAAYDRTPVIFENAFGSAGSPLCRKVIDLFLDILGAEAGNLALKLYARGGLYIGGGIVPRIADKVDFTGFLSHFRAKGKMEQLMKTIPVRLILRGDAALLGAAGYGQELFTR